MIPKVDYEKREEQLVGGKITGGEGGACRYMRQLM